MANVNRELTPAEKAWVDHCIATLTVDEKIGQMVTDRGGELFQKADPVAWFQKHPLGGFYTNMELTTQRPLKFKSTEQCAILTRNTIQETGGETKTTSYQEIVDAAKIRIPPLFCSDFESGMGTCIEGFTALPRMMGVSATFSEQDCYDYGKVIASEARASNIRWCYNPVSDLNLNRENPITSIRSCGDNPDHAIKVLTNIMRGLQENGVAACAKHFPGDGTDTRNQHLVTSFNLLSKTEWDRFHGRVFKALIDAGVMSVMIGHIAFPAYEKMDESKRKFCPGTCSRRIITDLLRGELGFKGLVLSDALRMIGYWSWADFRTRTLDSLNAGIDVFLWPDTDRFFDTMHELLDCGAVTMERIDESVRRVLEQKAKLDMIPETDPGIPPKETVREIIAENQKIAQRIAEDSITLLRNFDNAIPLKLKEGAGILVLYAPEVKVAARQMEYFARKLEERSYKVTLGLLPKSGDYREKLGDYDCVMVVSDANPQYVEHRTADWGVWDIVGNEKIRKLIVLSFGTPYFLYDMASAATYINAYHDCNFSIDAAVKAMFGEIPFKGRSPVSVPYCFSFGDGLQK